MKFTIEKTTLLDTIVGNFSRQAKHSIIQTYKDFTGDMNKFLKEIEEGYMMTIDDYTK